MSDVKGKEMEQERKGRIKNDEIDLKRTNLNFDLVEDERHLYHRVKDRVDYYKEQGSRVQKNSVVMYSNIITLSKEEADRMGETRTKHYFKTCKITSVNVLAKPISFQRKCIWMNQRLICTFTLYLLIIKDGYQHVQL